MSGVTGWGTPLSAIPKGSERAVYYQGKPPAAGGASGNWWRRANGSVAAAAIGGETPATAGAGLTTGYSIEPAVGAYRSLYGVENVAPTYLTIAGPGFQFLPPNMGAPLTVPQMVADEVLIFREAVQWRDTGAINPAHTSLHGFSLTGNLIGGFPLLGAGSWRGIALCRRAGGFFLAVKNANPATLIALPGVDLVATRGVAEHRLYKPTAARIGRYEFWLNGAKVTEVLGTHANFPAVTTITDAWQLLPFALDNPGGATTVELRAWWGELILGPDSLGTY